VRSPRSYYRLWCGKKCYSAWLLDRDDIFERAAELGLGFRNGNVVSLGPLTWIEQGERKYARSRTIPLPRSR